MEPGWLDEIEPATRPPFVRMGTRALGRGAWLLDGPDVPAQLAEKQLILAAHHDAAVAALDGTEPAAAELLALVQRTLALTPPPAAPPAPPHPHSEQAARRPTPTPPAGPTAGRRCPPSPEASHPASPVSPGTGPGSSHPMAPAPLDTAPRPSHPANPVPPNLNRGPTQLASATPPSPTHGRSHPASPTPPGTSPGSSQPLVPPGAPVGTEAHPGRRPTPVGTGGASSAPGGGADRLEPSDGPEPGGRHPIDIAGRLVAEDLCLLVPGDGGWVLGAGSVCFPSHWRLTDKLGLPLAAVHAPVPDYAAELTDRVDRVLDKLRAGRAVVRRNWTIHTSPDLYAPDAPAPPDPPITPDEAGQRLWLRSERQTLVRLPRTGAIAFTIRTQQTRLAAVANHPDLRARLASAVAAWPSHQVAYRGGEAIRRPLLAWLRAG